MRWEGRQEPCGRPSEDVPSFFLCFLKSSWSGGCWPRGASLGTSLPEDRIPVHYARRQAYRPRVPSHFREKVVASEDQRGLMSCPDISRSQGSPVPCFCHPCLPPPCAQAVAAGGPG